MKSAIEWDLGTHCRKLEQYGFTIIPQVLSAQEILDLRNVLDVVYENYDPLPCWLALTIWACRYPWENHRSRSGGKFDLNQHQRHKMSSVDHLGRVRKPFRSALTSRSICPWRVQGSSDKYSTNSHSTSSAS